MTNEAHTNSFERGVSRFFQAIFDQYGYDFRDYTSRIKRSRIQHCLEASQAATIDELTAQVCSNREFFLEILSRLTITVTGLFRDPEFFLSFRENAVPQLRNSASLKFWHPGCASGEELISMAILLWEADLFTQSILYGTDINPKALAIARRGVVPADVIKRSCGNYHRFRGQNTLTDYFQVNHGFGHFNMRQSSNIVYSIHNLVTDTSFGEMDVICCRNVLIYFGDNIRDRALRLLTKSLKNGGFLCLGMHETLMFSSVEKDYEEFDRKNKIYRKTKTTP